MGVVMDQGTLVGGDVRGLVIPPERAVNIDTLDDFERAEKILPRELAAR
jgi:GTP:adenosylcobinamide-phosphate guanylyltransferase